MAFRKSVFQTFNVVRARSNPSQTLLRSFATTGDDSNEDSAKSTGDTKDQKKNKRSQAALELLQELLREPTPEPEKTNNGGARPAVVMNKHHHNKSNPTRPSMSTFNEKLDIINGVSHTPLTVEEKSTWPWKDQMSAESDCKEEEMDEVGSPTSLYSSAFDARSGAAAPVYDDHADDHNDPFNKFQPGDFCAPEDLNWYNTENDEERKKTRYVVKPAKLFQRANQDPLELALNPDLLRHFLSPTGRIQPRRFTGLSAKEQRQMKRAVKLSRNLALLPFLSQYPRPSLEQRNELLGHRGSDDFQLYSQGLTNADDEEDQEKKHNKSTKTTTRNRSSSSSFDARGYEMQQVEESEEDVYKIDLDLEGLDNEFKKKR